MSKVLVINAHHRYEGFSEGRINKIMLDVMTDEMSNEGCELAFTHIEQQYDINEEVNKHLCSH